jgi:hypothetical protein
MGLIASTFSEIDSLFDAIAQQTGLTRTQLIARWQGSDVKGPNSTTTWNMYMRYYSENKDTEAARVTNSEVMLHSTAFRALSYAKYQAEVPDWQERLALYEELESFSTKGMSVAQRARAFRKYSDKLKKMVCTLYCHCCLLTV